MLKAERAARPERRGGENLSWGTILSRVFSFRNVFPRRIPFFGLPTMEKRMSNVTLRKCSGNRICRSFLSSLTGRIPFQTCPRGRAPVTEGEFFSLSGQGRRPISGRSPDCPCRRRRRTPALRQVPADRRARRDSSLPAGWSSSRPPRARRAWTRRAAP